MEEVLVDWPALEATGRQIGERAFQQLLGMMPGTLADCRQRLAAADPVGSPEGLRQVVHEIKGIAGNFSCSRAQRLAQGIETALRAGIVPSEAIGTLGRVLAETESAFAHRLEAGELPQPPT